MPSDGPFGTAPDIGVGFSDAALLVASGLGFLVLSMTVYSIVITKLKSAEEIEEEAEDFNYDEKLANADVSKLTRAQRRARARYIMKQQRRVAPAGPGGTAPTNEEGQMLLENEANPGGDHPDDQAGTMSRKERQKAAKLAEKEERKLFEEERRKQQIQAQAVAQKEKQQREKIEAQKAEEERILKQKQKEEQERKDYENWKIFLGSGETQSISVLEFIEEMKVKRVESIETLAERFEKSPDEVVQRIRDLIEANRISGMLENDRFMYLSDEELVAIATAIKSRDQTSGSDVYTILQRVISS